VISPVQSLLVKVRRSETMEALQASTPSRAARKRREVHDIRFVLVGVMESKRTSLRRS